MHVLTGMTITADTTQVLERLKHNREKHKKIVIEAREGYAKQAEKALSAELERLRKGKNVVVTFSLQAPQDYTKVYDTAIEMLQMHTQPKIDLNSSQVRNLMQDEWDWKSHFLMSNSLYSLSAQEEVGSAASGTEY
jgi:hypothetical protein